MNNNIYYPTWLLIVPVPSRIFSDSSDCSIKRDKLFQDIFRVSLTNFDEVSL